MTIEDRVDRLVAETAFSGVVRIDRGGEVELLRAWGMADRGHDIPCTVDTRFAIASGVKGMTALTAMALVEAGVLALDTTARSLLGTDLPLIDDAVTVEHLLAHRSGIGDYVDEDLPGDVNDHILPVPVHLLDTTEAYLRVLDGFPQKFAPGTAFSYCNGGFVVLALLCERAAGVPFADLVARRVCEPAGMASTAFLRTDELPGDVAVGYLEATGLRTNALHLPVRGSGDGGIHTTVADVHRLWAALDAGEVVPAATYEAMTTPRSETASGMRYGLGFWLPPSGAVELEGCDAGVSFRSTHDPATATTSTVISNTSNGAWPIVRLLEELLG